MAPIPVACTACKWTGTRSYSPDGAFVSRGGRMNAEGFPPCPTCGGALARRSNTLRSPNHRNRARIERELRGER